MGLDGELPDAGRGIEDLVNHQILRSLDVEFHDIDIVMAEHSDKLLEGPHLDRDAIGGSGSRSENRTRDILGISREMEGRWAAPVVDAERQEDNPGVLLRFDEGLGPWGWVKGIDRAAEFDHGEIELDIFPDPKRVHDPVGDQGGVNGEFPVTGFSWMCQGRCSQVKVGRRVL